MEEKNAIITGVDISNADHGMLTVWINLNYGDSAQSFGGYALYFPRDHENWRKQKNAAGHFLWRVMEVTGVTNWNKLKDKTVRVRIDNSDRIIALGHIIKDDWFVPADEFEQMRNAP